MCLRQTKTAAHLIAHPCNPAPRLLVPASKHRPSGEEFLFGPCGRRASARLASSHKLGRPVGLAVGWAPTGLELNRIGLVLEAWRTLAGLVQEPWRYLTTVWRSTARSAARATARPQRRRREDFAPRMGCGQQETPARLTKRRGVFVWTLRATGLSSLRSFSFASRPSCSPQGWRRAVARWLAFGSRHSRPLALRQNPTTNHFPTWRECAFYAGCQIITQTTLPINTPPKQPGRHQRTARATARPQRPKGVMIA